MDERFRVFHSLHIFSAFNDSTDVETCAKFGDCFVEIDIRSWWYLLRILIYQSIGESGPHV